MKMLYILPLFCCYLVMQGIASSDGAAICDEVKFDEVAGKLLLYSNDDLQPETNAELMSHCQKDNETFEWIENYSKGCIKGIAGGVMRLLLDSSGEELHNRCYGHLQEEYLKHTPCLNTVRKELATCNEEMTSLLESTMKLQKRRHLLAHSCCSIQIYAECLESRGREKCNRESGEFMKGIIHRIGEHLLEGACGKFTPESDECKNLPKSTKSKTRKYRSFVPAMISTLQQYG